MNNLDMYTREKANKIHLDEMRREAQGHRMRREAGAGREPGGAAGHHRRFVALAVSILIAMALLGIVLLTIRQGVT